MKASLLKFVQPGPSINGKVLQTAALTTDNVDGVAACESITIDQWHIRIKLVKCLPHQRLEHCFPLCQAHNWIPIDEQQQPQGAQRR